jgi:hypothetical protein
MEPLLPQIPPGLELFAWHGMALPVPADWNLSFHAGNWGRGALVISDVKGPAIDVRWRRPALAVLRWDARREFRRMRERVARRAAVAGLGDSAISFSRDGTTVVLAADRWRIYEMTLRRPEASGGIADYFLAATNALAGAPRWPWAAYAIRGDAPARARLREAVLQPGNCRLTIAGGGERVQLGAVSLADRQLSGRSLQQWAQEASLVRPWRNGSWRVVDAVVFYDCRSTRLLGRVRLHAFRFEHDVGVNCIRWSHRVRGE